MTVDAVDSVDSIGSIDPIDCCVGANASFFGQQRRRNSGRLLLRWKQVISDVLNEDTFTLRSFPFETIENCPVGRVAEAGGSSRLLVVLITHAHPLRTVVECQILPGHENTFKGGATRTWVRRT